jgi:hypothetical protein
VINGTGFIALNTSNSVVVTDTVSGKSITVTPTVATATSLTVSLKTIGTLTGGDHLTAVVTVINVNNSENSGAPVQVATIAPVVTASKVTSGATTLTIQGFGFDPNIANDSVTFTNNGTTTGGTVTAATATSLTVTPTGPLTVGTLSAVVTVNSASSGTAVQVATVVPVVTQNTAVLATAGFVVINGLHFDPTIAQNKVVFSNGAVGTVTASTTTSLTVTFKVKPTGTGALTAVVTVDGVSSGTAVQVASLAPVVTMSTAKLPAGAKSIVINGANFDPNHAQNTVVFSSGTGIVTAWSQTSITVTFLVMPKAGPLTVVVTSRHVSSGAPVQVATV